MSSINDYELKLTTMYHRDVQMLKYFKIVIYVDLDQTEGLNRAANIDSNITL